MGVKKTKLTKPQLAIVVAAEVVLAAFAWRDISQRADDQLRGKRRMWHVVILANPGNSILYWLFGRRSDR
ncbi:hypothetical protein SAMN05444157_3033 [Frankineae bacterium MT45]|nr:hypothetical protein SAMN05444157_3033 [Frankineae bacterium MT45]